MKIKICGLFREQDIDYVNEARPDYAGFVFAKSRRNVSPAYAAQLRRFLSDEIIPIGVFVNAPVADIAALYRENVIAVVQLHGTEDAEYIARLKEASAAGGRTPVAVIKTIKSEALEKETPSTAGADYYLIDSGAGTGKPFDWELLNGLVRQPGRLSHKSCSFSAYGRQNCDFYKEVVLKLKFPNNSNTIKIEKPWFLAGGVSLDNIEQALAFNPFALDISSGAETDGVKDRGKILQLVSIVRKGKNP